MNPKCLCSFASIKNNKCMYHAHPPKCNPGRKCFKENARPF